MLEILKAIVLGVVEGITEWLPISSTGHMILVNEFIKLKVSEEFWSLFEVVIQLGAILAVVLIFWNRIVPIRPLMTKKARKKERQLYKQRKDEAAANGRKFREPAPNGAVRQDVVMLWAKIIMACVPAIVVALPFDDFFEEHFYNPVCVSIMLILFGIAFIVIEKVNQGKRPRVKRIADLTIPMVLLIGVFQLIAGVFPGTSRSGATIVGALLLGISRTVAAEFTFYLAIPVMAGASLLKVLKFALSGAAMTGMEFVLLLVGSVIAFVVSMFVIKFLMGYIRKHTFVAFGVYRIVLGIIVLVYFALK